MNDLAGIAKLSSTQVLEYSTLCLVDSEPYDAGTRVFFLNREVILFYYMQKSNIHSLRWWYHFTIRTPGKHITSLSF
jgi:hypothetical protein